jgi:hypothetical protein
VEEFRETIAELNQRIQLYNLNCPAAVSHRKIINPDDLIRDLEAGG